MKSTFYLPVLFCALCVSLFFASCDKDDKTFPAYSLAGDGSGTLVVPAVTTGATSKFTGWYDSEQRLFTYSLSWYNLTDSFQMAYFHAPAPAGQNADTVTRLHIPSNRPFGLRGKTDSLRNAVVLTAAQEADLINGKWYYSIRSRAMPAGEVRGQISVVTKYD